MSNNLFLGKNPGAYVLPEIRADLLLKTMNSTIKYHKLRERICK